MPAKTLEFLGPSWRQHMLPVTHASLVSWMNANAPTPSVSEELVRYVRSEYGENAYYARALVDHAARTRLARSQNGTGGLVRRFLVAVAETLAAGRASPGGA